ncbi:hypothetical protein KVR01_004814 [Diaporthe batatas]|uniref:uncharacterized protein n=1 Tax=Diaporthe batatas TaxID=748121 RepID=UPI001D03A03D|nr:uncharacterized protein KVR01_004814 [Diaporthe batatas]KAG8166262.1 hypothetical protein KVR01_004814 [Diaporthe batatas]
MSLPSILENDKLGDEAVLRNFLSRSLPGSFGEDAPDMSSMDCFVAVIRHICSVVHGDLMQFVAADHGLRFVLADFSAETEEKRSSVQEYRISKFKHVERLVGKKNPTFEDIIECDAVLKNFWAHDGLLLFQTLIHLDEPNETWYHEADDRVFAAARSLVDWPLQKFDTIQDVLDMTKSGTSPNSGGQEVLFTPGRPAVVRVRLASKVDRRTWQGSFSIRDAQCFSYNEITRNTVWHPAENVTTIRETVSRKPQDRLVYCLIAVVRLRNPGEHCDYARLYDLQSQNVLPLGDQRYFGTFNNDWWSLEHLTHNHMLYYARVDYTSVDCVRLYTECEDQSPDPQVVRRDEMVLDAAWQGGLAMHESRGSGAPDQSEVRDEYIAQSDWASHTLD